MFNEFVLKKCTMLYAFSWNRQGNNNIVSSSRKQYASTYSYAQKRTLLRTIYAQNTSNITINHISHYYLIVGRKGTYTIVIEYCVISSAEVSMISEMLCVLFHSSPYIMVNILHNIIFFICWLPSLIQLASCFCLY